MEKTHSASKKSLSKPLKGHSNYEVQFSYLQIQNATIFQYTFGSKSQLKFTHCYPDSRHELIMFGKSKIN